MRNRAAGGGSRAWRPAAMARRATLTGRATALTLLVAVISVLVTALVAVPISIRTANTEKRTTLNREAILVASLLSTRSGDGEVIARKLRAQGVAVFLITGGKADRAGLPERIVRELAKGNSVGPRLAIVDGRGRLLAAQPVPGRLGNGVALTAVPITGLTAAVWNRLWLALLAGLCAGLAAGPLLARRLIRPIRQAAHAAARLSAGDRSVRIETGGPAEAAELAEAINTLAAALETSEGRQRDFLLSVSHELRTPLTTIKGYAEAIADGVVGPDGAQRAGRTMLDEAARLDRLIADLLVLARLEAADLPIHPIPVDLVELVSAASEAWGGRYAGAGLPLRVELPKMGLPVTTDPGRIRQIIDGLLENALRVVPPGAPVVLAARAPDALRPGFAIVEVRDGGPGLADEDLAVAFERGALYRKYQGVRKVGTGLGLALAARLTRRLGGWIEAGHAAEGGARFTVGLPSAPQGSQPPSYQARTLP
jgi:signal transduction histidine kinase